jgi:hypothetical protein
MRTHTADKMQTLVWQLSIDAVNENHMRGLIGDGHRVVYIRAKRCFQYTDTTRGVITSLKTPRGCERDVTTAYNFRSWDRSRGGGGRARGPLAHFHLLRPADRPRSHVEGEGRGAGVAFRHGLQHRRSPVEPPHPAAERGDQQHVRHRILSVQMFSNTIARSSRHSLNSSRSKGRGNKVGKIHAWRRGGSPPKATRL